MKELLQMDDAIDLVIPRGGEGLIREVARISKIPVIKHYKGICHVYIDKEADLNTALRIAFNAKCQRVSVGNAMETLLVHQSIAKKFLPAYGELLIRSGFELRGDQATRRRSGKIISLLSVDFIPRSRIIHAPRKNDDTVSIEE